MYCIDTSALIAAWEERYPPENFPRLWDNIAALIAGGRLTAPPEVLVETEKKSDELHRWLKEREAAFVTPYDDELLLAVRGLLGRFPRLVMEKKQRFAADPFVIALAQEKGLVVVTEEKPASLQRPNIPDVCEQIGQRYMPLLQMIRAEKWIVG